jgi:hypothetical protein
MSSGPVIYEVSLWPDPAIASDFDAWLEHHVQEMLGLPGFLGATIHRAEEDPPGDGVLRTVRYRLQDRAALDRYLQEHAERMRADGTRRFGNRFRVSRRILDAGRDIAVSAVSPKNCANCDSPLYGQYCAACGQRARGRMISLWELVKEASDILTSIDSRLWRTLGMLLFRPGRLTRDYLLGRRARYIPALRLFLGLSLLFFFLFSLDTRFSVSTDSPDAGDMSLQLQIGDDETPETPGEQMPGAPADPMRDAGTPDIDKQPVPEPGLDSAGRQDENPCADVQVNWPEGMEWANQWLSTQRMQSACEKIVADHGESFTRALLENIPAMMFVFVPLMAIVMKALYPLTRRYYVEHLLFLVHYHSFFYLLMSMILVAGWLFDGTFLPRWPATLVYTVSALYIPVYLFRAMRVVYEQGRLVTGLKYMLLGVAYFTSLLLFLVGTVTITAISI